jgi:hypothetical protein
VKRSKKFIDLPRLEVEYSEYVVLSSKGGRSEGNLFVNGRVYDDVDVKNNRFYTSDSFVIVVYDNCVFFLKKDLDVTFLKSLLDKRADYYIVEQKTATKIGGVAWKGREKYYINGKIDGSKIKLVRTRG